MYGLLPGCGVYGVAARFFLEVPPPRTLLRKVLMRNDLGVDFKGKVFSGKDLVGKVLIFMGLQAIGGLRAVTTRSGL